MPASTGSRSSSVFSVDTSLSSRTSYSLSPAPPLDCEKSPIRTLAPSLVLQWKPLLLSTAFTHNVATHLHFTAFPPQDLHKPLFEQLSMDSAQALLSEYLAPSTLSFLAQPSSTVHQVSAMPFPESLPEALRDYLQGDEWDYFSITNTTVPIGIAKLSKNFDHHVAIRPVADGVERYIFGPAGLCIHSVCRVQDVGAQFQEKIPRETLYLSEEAEVLCNKAMSKWSKSLISSRIAASHEQFRLEWDAAIRGDWGLMKMRQPADLLA